MDGCCRVVASPIDVTLANRTLPLRPLTLRDFGSAEFHLLANRRNPVDAVRHLVPALAGEQQELRREMVQRAVDEMRTDPARHTRRSWDEVIGWLHQPEGVVYSGWLCLYERYPQRFAALEQVGQLFARATDAEKEEFVRRRDMVSGLDAAAQADWPAKRGGTDDGDGGAAARAKIGKRNPWNGWAAKLLAEVFMGWDFESLAGLTLHQLRLCKLDKFDLGGTITMSYADWKAIQSRGET